MGKVLCDKNHRKTIAKSSHVSRTLRRRSDTHRNSFSAICTMRQNKCDTIAIDCDINKTILRLNCEKIKLARTS